MLALTDRGDTHLTHSLPPILARFEASAGVHLQHLVVDREGMATAFLQTLTAAGRRVTTLLRTNQYRDLASFTALRDWTPLTTDQHGTVVREVAPAEFTLPVPTAPATTLPLQVALIRDHRVQVPQRFDDFSPRRWDADLPPDAPHWWEATWKPIAAPAAPTTAKLIPAVSTGTGVAAADLAAIYRRRWVVQENSFKDWLIPLGLDVNHGYHKTAVENSEQVKRRTALETRLATLDRWARSAGERQQACLRYQRRREAHRADDRARYRMIRTTLFALNARRVSEGEYQQTRRALCADVDAASAIHRAAARQAEAERTQEYHKQHRYRQTQRRLLRELEDLNATERQMYVLDDRKDQAMTTFKLALVNLVMWTRDQWLLADYVQATWRRLEPFFRLSGRVHRHRDRVVLELRPFNDAALRRDLISLCARVTAAAPRRPDGRRLELIVGAGTQRRSCADYASSV